MKALSSATDKNRASIPFDQERSGFVMGEGSGILVLEEYEHAKKRGAKIYGEVIGYGATSDAYHITSPCPDGAGAVSAMNRAIKDAGILARDIDYINAHGTSTHLNDSCETMAIKKVMGEDWNNVLVSSMALENGIVPPTINYKVPDLECDLNIVQNEVIKKDLNVVMSNSLGFGGHNASIIFRKMN